MSFAHLVNEIEYLMVVFLPSLLYVSWEVLWVPVLVSEHVQMVTFSAPCKFPTVNAGVIIKKNCGWPFWPLRNFVCIWYLAICNSTSANSAWRWGKICLSRSCLFEANSICSVLLVHHSLQFMGVQLSHRVYTDAKSWTFHQHREALIEWVFKDGFLLSFVWKKIRGYIYIW